MDFTLLRAAVCIIGCTAATYYDLFNRRNVPTWVTYSLVALGVLFTLTSLNVQLIAWTFLAAIATFLLGYVLYRAGQVGGADVLMFVAIALLLPEAPTPLTGSANSPFNLPFVLSVFIISGVLAVFGIFLQYIPATIYEFLRGERIHVKKMEVFFALATLAVYLIFLSYFNSIVEMPSALLALFVAVVFCATCLFALKEHISRRYMIRMVGINEIDEEDILAIDEMDPAVVRKYKLDRLLTPSEVEKLKKIGKKKKFPVYKEMPVFMPYVLITLLIALFFGDPLVYLLPPIIIP